MITEANSAWPTAAPAHDSTHTNKRARDTSEESLSTLSRVPRSAHNLVCKTFPKSPTIAIATFTNVTTKE